MRTQKSTMTMGFLMAAAVFVVIPPASKSAEPPAGGYGDPGYYLTIAPDLPVAGQEVVVSLAGRGGQLEIGSVRWTLSGSGSPFTNAGVKGHDGLRYAFTPNGPGSFAVQAEFRDSRGTHIATALHLTISGPVVQSAPANAPPPQGAYYPGVVAPPATPARVQVPQATVPAFLPDTYGASLGANPTQPRIGQPVTLIFDNGDTIPPNGSQVRWDISGGMASDADLAGSYHSELTFVPLDQGLFTVRAEMYCPLGNLLGRATRQFTAVP